jgi:hypothetical protein
VATWQRISGVEVCQGTDGAVGIVWSIGSLLTIDRNGVQTSRVESFFHRNDAKGAFEERHCRPLHEIEECADGSVIVRSTEKIDGKTARCAMIRATVTDGAVWLDRGNGDSDWTGSKDEAIAAAVAYVSAR